MTRLRTWARAGGFGVAAAWGGFSASWAAEPERPNVLLILADDAETGDLGCYGGRVATPNLDRLAAEGMRFTRAYPNATVCTPSRYSILTGRFAGRSPLLQARTPPGEPACITWNTFIDPSDPAMGKAFQQQGYQTAFVGKWHVGNAENLHIPPNSWPGDPDYADRLMRNDRIRADFVQQSGGFDHARAVYDTNVRSMPLSSPLMGHHQHWLTYETLLQFKYFARQQRPWFLFHSTTIPHPPDILATLKGDPRATLRGYLEDHVNVQPGYEDLLRRTESYGPFPTWEAASETAGTLWLDDAVGRLMAELEQAGTLDDTIVLFTSDHDRGAKFTLHTRPVPLLVRWPGKVPAGHVEDALVSLVDLMPTLIDLTGGEVDPAMDLSGVSFASLLRGQREPVREDVYLEVTYTRGVVTDRYKYIATRFPDRIARTLTPENRKLINQEGRSESFGDPDGKFVRYDMHLHYPGYFDDDQLYDLKADPDEQRNLTNDPAHAEVLADMKRRLSRCSAQLPLPFGEFKRAQTSSDPH